MSEKKVGIIIQARLGSTRLPRKILLPINNKPILQIQINRLKKIKRPIYIATTTHPQDLEIKHFSELNNLPCFMGDEENVLKRYYDCAKKFNLDVIVRITSDCPLLDVLIINKAIRIYLKEDNVNLFLSNTIERTYPRGFDFEIFSFALLEQAFFNAKEYSDLEHVTPFIWRNKLGNVLIKQFKNINVDNSKYRLTLDTEEDYILIKKLIEEYRAESLTGEEIISILVANPTLAKINQHIEQKEV